MDRTSLARATEPTDAPTPGYLYIDIAKNAAGSPVICAEIAQYLTSRLVNKANPNVKFKCLKVISKTAVNPITRGQFKRQIAQDSSAVAAIKEALQFRGPPDPARGDEPYVKVRTAAKEALDAIYSDSPTSTEPPNHHYGAPQGGGGGYAPSRSTGFDTNPNQLHQPPPASGTGRRMEGIGNPMYKDPRTLDSPRDIGTMTIGDIAKEATSTIANMIKDPLAKNVPMGPPKYGNSSYGPPPGSMQLAQSTGGQWTMASNRGTSVGAGYGGNASYGGQSTGYGGQSTGGGFSASQPGGVGGSWGTVETAVPISVASQARQLSSSTPQIGVITSNYSGSGGIAVNDGSFEKNMILELCPPGGVKAEPPPDKLARFAQAVPSLNADLICPALLDCLEEGNPWVIRAKALCVIETCINMAEQYKPGDNAYAAFFYACRGEIEPLAGHARLPIQQPALRILKLLGISGGIAAAYPAAPPAAAPAADLLDFGAEPVVPPSTNAPPQTPSTPKADGGLFGGLNLADVPKTPGGSLLDMTSVPNAAGASMLSFPSMDAPSTEGSGFFGGMAVKETPTENSATSGGGLFGDMIIKGTPAAESVSSGGGRFGDVVVNEALSAASDVADLGAATSGGSAFGFMNSAPPAPIEVTQVFDPLLSLSSQPSPTTAKAMMANLGPEQLNAMYAQQSMLLMQQQMQQMQLMMMQQQKIGSGGTPMMMQGARGSNPHVMGSNANFAASSGFSFLDDPRAGEVKKKEDKSFDFVKDAMKNEKK